MSSTSTQKQGSYILPIIMMIALFGMISFVTGLQNPMGVIVKSQFGASNLMSQLGNAANFIAYAVMGLPAGWLLIKVGYKKTALLAIIVGFVGVGIQFLSGQVGSFPVFLIGAFVSGFSMCMLNTVVNPMLNTLAGGGRKGNQLIQVGGTFNSLNATIVPVLVGYFIGNSVRPTIKDANPALFIAMGVFVLVFIVLSAMKLPEPNATTGEKKTKEKSKYSPLSFRHFVLGAIAIFIYVGVEVGIPNISNLYMNTMTNEQFVGYEAEHLKQKADPAYLEQVIEESELAIAEADKALAAKADNAKDLVKIAKQKTSKIISADAYEAAKKVKVPGLGMDPVVAGSVVGTYWFLMLIGRLFGVVLAAKFSSRAMLGGVSILGMVLVCAAIFLPITYLVSMPVFQSDISFGMAKVPVSVMLLILCGLCTSVMWGGIFNQAVEGLGKYTAAASGIFMVMVCGGGVIPLIQAAVIDWSSYLASFWVIFICLVFLLYYSLAGSKNVNTDIPV